MRKRIARGIRRRLRKARKKSADVPYALASRVCRFDPRESLIICSDPRGGSTWITEVVSRISKTAVLWEPLNGRQVPYFRPLKFAWRDPLADTDEYRHTSPLVQHIPEDADWPEARAAFEQLLQGKVLNAWMGFMASPVDLVRAERLLVKFIHANALLPWLTRAFSFRYAPIHLVRHPFAVVASQVKHGNWDYDFVRFPLPDGPYSEYYTRHAAFLAGLTTREEMLTAAWCFSNLVPLQSARRDEDWITIHYEHLLLDPEADINRVFKRWGLPVPEGALDEIRTPSASAKETTFQDSVEKQLAKWTSVFSPDQLRRMAAVLNYFEVAHYDQGLYPKVPEKLS